MKQKPSYEELESRIEALERSNETLSREVIKYKTLFEKFPYGITVSDADGKILETNGIAEGMLGVSREECTRRTLDDQEWRIVRADGSDMPRDEWPSVLALREDRLVANCKMGVVKPEGTVTWIDVTAAPIPVDGAGVVVIYHDVTASKIVEDELSQVFSMSLDMICIADINTATFKKVNPAFTETLGFSEEELLDQAVLRLHSSRRRRGNAKGHRRETPFGGQGRQLRESLSVQGRKPSLVELGEQSDPRPRGDLCRCTGHHGVEREPRGARTEQGPSRCDGQNGQGGGMGAGHGHTGGDVDRGNPSHPRRPLGVRRPSLETAALEFFHPEDRPRLEEAIRCAPSTMVSPMIWNFVSSRDRGRSSGRGASASRWSSMVTVRGLKGTFQDVTDRREAQDAVRKSEERLRAAIDKSPFPVAFVDTGDEWVRFWSQSAIKMLGHTPRNVSEWYELAYPDPFVQRRRHPSLETIPEVGPRVEGRRQHRGVSRDLQGRLGQGL